MNRASLILFALALAAVVAGVWLLLPAAALIVAGALLAGVGVLLFDLPDRRKS